LAQALREALLASVWVAALAGCAVLSARLRAEAERRYLLEFSEDLCELGRLAEEGRLEIPVEVPPGAEVSVSPSGWEACLGGTCVPGGCPIPAPSGLYGPGSTIPLGVRHGGRGG